MADAGASAAARNLGAKSSIGLRASATGQRNAVVDAALSSDDLRLLIAGLPGPTLLFLAMMLQSSAIAVAASGLMLVSAVAYPALGLLQLALIAPVLGRPIIPYPGLMFMLIAAIVVGSLFRLPIDRPRISLPPGLLVIGAFMVYVAVQQLPAMLDGYTGEGLGVGSVFLRYLTAATAAVAAGWVLTGRAPYPYLASLLLGGMLSAGLGIVMFVQPSLIGALADLILRPDRTARPAGPMTDPNYFGMLMATLLTAAFAWLGASRQWRVRTLLIVSMGLLAAGLTVSQSRSAVLAVVAGVLVVAFTRGRKAGLAVLALVGALAVVLVPVFMQWRVTNTGGAVNALSLSRLAESDEGRLDLVLEGPRLFLESPVFGVGLGVFVQQVGDASHNWYSLVLAEQGSVGVTLVALLAMVIYRALRDRPTAARSLGYGVLAVLAVGAFFLEPTLETQWSVPAIIAVTAAVVADWRPRQTPASGPTQPFIPASHHSTNHA